MTKKKEKGRYRVQELILSLTQMGFLTGLNSSRLTEKSKAPQELAKWEMP
jgi:hypothetical protein